MSTTTMTTSAAIVTSQVVSGKCVNTKTSGHEISPEVSSAHVSCVLSGPIAPGGQATVMTTLSRRNTPLQRLHPCVRRTGRRVGVGSVSPGGRCPAAICSEQSGSWGFLRSRSGRRECIGDEIRDDVGCLDRQDVRLTRQRHKVSTRARGQYRALVVGERTVALLRVHDPHRYVGGA